MAQTVAPSDKNNRAGSRGLVVVLFGVIVAAFLAFLLLRPAPSTGRVPVSKTPAPTVSPH